MGSWEEIKVRPTLSPRAVRTHFWKMGSRIRETDSVYELKWVVTAKLTLLPPPSKIAHTVLLVPHITR